MLRTALLTSTLLAVAYAQQVGTQLAETHPSLSWKKCTTGGGCTTVAGSIVLDANWRWLHTTTGYTNCYTGNTWDTSLCPNPTTCAQNCALDGANYSGTYGITTSSDSLTLKFKTGSNVGSRVYLMASETAYQMFKPLNQEFTFDVDVSGIGCGINGALYFSEMVADGGLSAYPGNKAGAKYGTGYCDAQCPHDLKFINGEANVLGWTGQSNDANSGAGQYGSCCPEMDVWEANNVSTAYTPHPCTHIGPYRCSGSTECGDGSDRYAGNCDKDGCDWNAYRMGDTSFYGAGKKVNTNSKFTVVTQFITDTGTSSGTLKEIRRLYVQNGQVIANSHANISGIDPSYDSLTDGFCEVQKTVFGDNNQFKAKGGMAAMGQSLANGVVLVMSIWDDHSANMLWLDSTYPVDSTKPGAARGTCPTTSGVPADVEANQANSQVIFSNIRFGDLNSTYSGTVTSTSSTRSTSSTSTSSRSSSTSSRSTSTSSSSTRSTSSSSSSRSSSTSTRTSTSAQPGQTLWGQCGGQNWTGPTTCAQGTCKYSNPWYSQCLN